MASRDTHAPDHAGWRHALGPARPRYRGAAWVALWLAVAAGLAMAAERVTRSEVHPRPGAYRWWDVLADAHGRPAARVELAFDLGPGGRHVRDARLRVFRLDGPDSLPTLGHPFREELLWESPPVAGDVVFEQLRLTGFDPTDALRQCGVPLPRGDRHWPDGAAPVEARGVFKFADRVVTGHLLYRDTRWRLWRAINWNLADGSPAETGRARDYAQAVTAQPSVRIIAIRSLADAGLRDRAAVAALAEGLDATKQPGVAYESLAALRRLLGDRAARDMLADVADRAERPSLSAAARQAMAIVGNGRDGP